ncbi:MAG: hypothetical protein JSS79_08600 [Bacteroidetes bacterium]|nr:hypothetical protein [Bacteroidota bacterium]
MSLPCCKKFFGLLFLIFLNAAAFAFHPSDSVRKENKKRNDISDSVGAHWNQQINSNPDSLHAWQAQLQNHFDELYDDGLIISDSNEGDTIRAIIAKASSILKKIKEGQKFIHNLNDKYQYPLPVGISKTIAGADYTIGIDAIRLKPTYAEVDVYMQFEVPQNGKKLTFMAQGIKFSKAGGIIGDAKLALVGDFAVNFNGDKGQLVLKGGVGGTGGTFIRMDCDGFKEMGLDAEVKFSRDLLLPEDATGAVKPGNVIASFKTIISGWNDLLVQITLPNFQVVGLNGFGFSVNDAVFDFSDTHNAPSVVFPKGYAAETDLELVNLWRGIYVRQLSVRLPNHFKDKKKPAITLSANDLLIDHQGVSGLFTGTNLIPLDNGDMSGWAFSVDSLKVSLMANQIQSAGFKGDIVIPVSSKQNSFKYNASFSANDQYLFQVISQSDMKFDLFKAAKVEINKGSSLEVKIANGKFLPKAILSGKMDIAAKLSENGQAVQLADIRFENLQIQAVQPYIKVGNFSFGSDAAKQVMAGFPIHVTKVGMKNITPDQVGLSFDMKLNLVGESGGAFAADAGLTIIGQMSSSDGSQSWQYKDIEVRDISINVDQGEAFKFKGSLTFYKQDPVYGDGFHGVLDASFLSKLTVKATAIFGNLKGERYWYADALAKFNSGIPFVPGVGFYGFGGGVYYRMKMDKDAKSPIGQTASGVAYVPELNNGLGFKAIVYIGSYPSDKAFSGDVTFQIDFFKGGGIHSISFTGNAYIASDGLGASVEQLKSTVGKMQSKISELEASTKARVGGIVSKISPTEAKITESIQGPVGDAAGSKGAISAHIFISYDFETSTLHANLDVGINVVGGIIKGGGGAILHFSPEEWYVYVGTPDNRFSISVGVGPIRATATSYFMVGSTIPGSPPPPPEVSEILKGVDLDYMKDLNAIGNGAGIAFGASLGIKTGDITFLIFYANFSLGAGFDIMLKNYGNTYCEGSSSPIGINGWYANGQAYAYFTGSIGIKINVFFSSIRIEILKIGAAVVLQAKLPNPIWLRGTVGGYFSVLGGLASGQCSFQVTIGSECKLVQKSDDSKLKNIAVIAQLTPGTGETNVNVFSNPQAVFNLPVDKPFDLDNTRYRVALDYFTLTAGGNSVQGKLGWNQEKSVAVVSTFDVLPPKQEIKSSVQVSFEKMVNGSWQKVLQNGQPIIEKQEITFTTGEAPDYIPLSNVEYSYPVIGQLNFYKDESADGYIKLKKGQPYLFSPGAEWRQEGRFADINALSNVPFAFTYSAGNALLNFSIPNTALKNGLVYGLQFVNVPNKQSGAVDRNVSGVSEQVTVNGQSTNTEIKTQQAQGSLVQLQEKTIFSAFIRSSKYSTLSAKVAAQNLATALRGIRILWRVDFLKGSFESDEPFDKAELYGTDYTMNKPLLSFDADLTDNTYYVEQANPIIYDGYPLDGDIRIKNRDESTLGVPPVKAVSVIQTPDNLELDQNDPQYQPVHTSQYYFYDVLNYMYYDFQDIQQRVANRYLSQSIINQRMEKILWSQFPIMRKGNYKVNVRYTLPNRPKENSTKQLILYNPIGQ